MGVRENFPPASAKARVSDDLEMQLWTLEARAMTQLAHTLGGFRSLK